MAKVKFDLGPLQQALADVMACKNGPHGSDFEHKILVLMGLVTEAIQYLME